MGVALEERAERISDAEATAFSLLIIHWVDRGPEPATDRAEHLVEVAAAELHSHVGTARTVEFLRWLADYVVKREAN